jgi:hypothetical protein
MTGKQLLHVGIAGDRGVVHVHYMAELTATHRISTANQGVSCPSSFQDSCLPLNREKCGALDYLWRVQELRNILKFESDSDLLMGKKELSMNRAKHHRVVPP